MIGACKVNKKNVLYFETYHKGVVRWYRQEEYGDYITPDTEVAELRQEVNVNAMLAENQRLREAGIAALRGLLYAVGDLEISLGAEALACCNGYEGSINAFEVFGLNPDGSLVKND